MNASKTGLLSVIIPIYNEEKYIVQCIESILQQDYQHDNLEILLVDGMSNDSTRRLIDTYVQQYPFLRLVDNPHRIVPYAMNIGINEAHGDIIIRLDAHAHYPNNYFSVLTRHLTELDADNVGAVCHTDVLNKTPKALAIKEVLSNRFGVGNSSFRIGIEKTCIVDTVPFGCWPKRVFKTYGLFDTRLIRNQDIELNKRITRGGGKIYLVPDTYSTYYARETYAALAKNNFSNGKWNILTVRYTHLLHSLSLRHFIPLLFVLSIAVPLLTALLYFPLVWIAVASACTYLIFVFGVSARQTIEKHVSFIHLVWAYIVLHTSYGFGSLCGICSRLTPEIPNHNKQKKTTVHD